MFIDNVIIKNQVSSKPFRTTSMALCFSVLGSDGYFFRLNKDKPTLHSNSPPSSVPMVSNCRPVPRMVPGDKIHIILMERDASMKNYGTTN